MSFGTALDGLRQMTFDLGENSQRCFVTTASGAQRWRIVRCRAIRGLFLHVGAQGRECGSQSREQFRCGGDQTGIRFGGAILGTGGVVTKGNVPDDPIYDRVDAGLARIARIKVDDPGSLGVLSHLTSLHGGVGAESLPSTGLECKTAL